MKRNQQLILKKLSNEVLDINDQTNIDTLKDFPLKTENDLNKMETKLKNDSIYREQMVSCSQNLQRLPVRKNKTLSMLSW